MTTGEPAQDKVVERDRYNERAGSTLAVRGQLPADGAEGVAIELRTPYLAYERAITAVVRPGARVLDVCCGDGLHSLTAARCGAQVTVSDIAENNVLLAAQRAERAGFKISTVVADAEDLPCDPGSFDVVTCAGSLSYVDLGVFLSGIERVLKPGGAFVCVDSLNHNPIYRFNRYLHYLRGERSKTVISRTPTLHTITSLRCRFPVAAEVRFFGIFAFLVPLLKVAFGSERSAVLLDRMDAKCSALGRFGFKFVFSGQKPTPC